MDGSGLAVALGAAAGAAGLAVALRARWTLAAASTERAALRAQVTAHEAAARGHETLLHAIMESTATSVVLFADAGRIVFANAAARELLFDGKPVDGQNFLAMLARAPEALRLGLLAGGDELFTVEKDGERETFHLSKQALAWQGSPHTMMAIKPVGTAMAREENAGLKKVIRIIGHEIGNSL